MDSYISLDNLRFRCILGILPEERLHPQKISIDLKMFFNTRTPAYSQNLKDSVDYAQIFLEMNFILLAAEFDLLETAAECLASYLLAPTLPELKRVQVKRIELHVKKIGALKNHGTPGVFIIRNRGDYYYRQEISRFGSTDVIFDNDQLGLYRLHVAPGLKIPRHYHSKLDEAEMPLTSGLSLQGMPAAQNSMFFWPKKFVHEYENLTTEEQIILCLDRPAFIPSDEIETTEPLSCLDNLPRPKSKMVKSSFNYSSMICAFKG